MRSASPAPASSFESSEIGESAAVRRLVAPIHRELFDAAPEPAFDRLAAFATRLLHVPTALICVADEQTEWCKASVGLPSQGPRHWRRAMGFTDAAAAAPPTAPGARDQDDRIFCDPSSDARFRAHPLLQTSRFLAIAPLRLPGKNHRIIGALVILTPWPRTDGLDDEEWTTLGRVAELAVAAVEHRLDQQRLAEETISHLRTEAHWRRSEAHYGRAAAAGALGIIFQLLLNKDGTLGFTLLSDSVQEILGVEAQTVQRDADAFLQLLAPADRQSWNRSITAAAFALSPWSWEGRFQLPDGRVKWLRATASPERQRDGAILFDGLATDITSHQEAEEALRIANEQLEARVAERTASLQAANAALELEMAERRRTEAALRESDALSRAIIEGTTDSIYVKDLQGRYVLINQAGANIIGKPVEAIIGHTDVDLFPDPVASRIMTRDRTVLAQGRSLNYETRRILHNGDAMEFLSNHSPLRDPARRVTGVIGISRDVTELKRGERQQQAVAELGQRALVGRELEPLFVEAVKLVAETLEVDFSAALEHLPAQGKFARRAAHGWTPRMMENAPPKSGPASAAGYALTMGGPVVVEDVRDERRFRICPVMRDAGATCGLTVLIAGENHCDPGAGRQRGQPFGVLNAFSRRMRSFTQDDVFFLQSIANVLAAAHGRQRTVAALDDARLEAQRADQAKSEFLSRISHELRTPLNAVLGFGQLLEMSTLDSRQRESTRHILTAGRHLLGLIDEVLDLACIESGRLEFTLTPVPWESLLRDCVAMLQPQAAQRSISLVLEPAPADVPGFVLADERRLRQVVLNLLSNAVKYHHPTGRVNLSLTRVDGDGAPRVRIAVQDNGPGIAPEDLPRLFTPFERLSAQHGSVEGSGLGLAVSKRLIEAQHGAIGVTSQPNEGSCFWVELASATPQPTSLLEAGLFPALGVENLSGLALPSPASANASAGARESHSAAAAAPARLTVLQIEDNASNRRLLERVLLFCPGVRLLSAHDGRSGLAAARMQRPDLIFLDLQLPDLDGAKVLEELKADPATAAAKIIMVTADASPGRTQALLDAGATGYLTKPLNVHDLMRAVEATLLAHPVAGRVAGTPLSSALTPKNS
ncbi:MAG: PAS domain S-box protein [Verrucomicrobia bacterium]|nr:PAS domain S-box protein [Verrucomicrobiota bacterium]